MKRRFLPLLLCAALLLSLSACVAKVETEKDEDDEVPDATPIVETEPVATEAPQSGYKLAAGAASEQELYEAAVRCLRNGTNTEELGEAQDGVLTAVFIAKHVEEPEENALLGLTVEESCELVARLVERMPEIGLPVDEDGELEADLLDYDALLAEFPEPLRSQIDTDNYYIQFFFTNLYYTFNLGNRPQNGSSSDAEKTWEAEENPVAKPYHKSDLDEDIYTTFPALYEMPLGTFTDDTTEEVVSMLYTEIEGRYYLLSFSYVIY